MIYASFLKEYKINILKESKDLKWKEFIVLLTNLSEESALMKVIMLRKKNPNEIKDIELKRIRERYLLREEKQNALQLFYDNWERN